MGTSSIFTRRSIRKYKKRPLREKQIREIIEAGRHAPSSHNSQPWRFVVITNKKKIKEISDMVSSWYKTRMLFGRVISAFNPRIKALLAAAKRRMDAKDDLFFYSAPCLILIFAKKGMFSVQDCSLAAENMMLRARDLGIGSCWIGFADRAFRNSCRLKHMLGIDNCLSLSATLVFGYPESFPDKPGPRKEEASIIKFIK